MSILNSYRHLWRLIRFQWVNWLLDMGGFGFRLTMIPLTGLVLRSFYNSLTGDPGPQIGIVEAALWQLFLGALALAGFSFGAFVATKLAERHPPHKLALVGLAASRFPATTVPPETFVLHGEADEVVPLSAVMDWARPQALPVTVLPGTGHYFHGQLPLLKRLLLQAWSFEP